MNLEKSKKIRLIESAFGKSYLEAGEENIHVSCPECNDHREAKKKLYIAIETGWYNCWVCSISGKNINFLFRKYASKYAKKCQELYPSSDVRVEVKKEEEAVSLPEDVRLVSRNSRDPDVRAVYTYLRNRGLTQADILRWRVCTSNEFGFRRKSIFPSFDSDGKLNYYVARSIDEIKFKYKNAKISKSTIVFNEIDIDWTQPVILVEGVFDAVKCPDNTVIALGSSLSKKSKLYRAMAKNKSTVIVCFDEDAEQKSHRVCKALMAAGCSVFKTTVKGRDLGDRTKEEVRKVLSKARPWRKEEMLNHKISCIKSGSVL